ncbi:MAG: phosphoribosylglycinamide formyltransferase [Proteobacteria bacterium]|nr:phosphoribosylglycinamide formyltransferase [Pseudomonadota bacterium]MBU1710972.1 phosphoribosylglycinamide formyltransferase [Pseudomonadota bacterium]
MKLAVLLSGSGRTLDNFHERIKKGTLNATIDVVISNVADALGLTKAKKYGYPAFHAKDNQATNEILKGYDIDLICLAGYLKLYEPPLQLRKAVLNIHPSLIPAFCGDGFYGMRVHRAAKERGVKVSGCTVHFANEEYDEGPIVVQKCVPLDEEDTPKDIAAKVFDMECIAFPEAINLVAAKGIDHFWP